MVSGVLDVVVVAVVAVVAVVVGAVVVAYQSVQSSPLRHHGTNAAPHAPTNGSSVT